MTTELTEVSRESINATTKRFTYSMKTGDRLVIFIEPQDNVKITNWSQDETVLNDGHQPPFFIYHVTSMVTEPFEFWLQFEHDQANTDGPYFKMAVVSHFLYHQEYYTDEYKEFLGTFPDWTYTTDWISSYESWVF